MTKQLAILLLISTTLVGRTQPTTKRVLVEGNGPPIVLLHGGTFDYNDYAEHSKLLADSYTVIRMMQFNVQSASEGWTLPQNYSVRMESEGVKSTLDSLQIARPVILVGHSYGGVIAFDLALNHPESIHSLVLVEAPLFDIAKVKGEYSQKMKEIDELTRHFTPHADITEEMIKNFRCKMADCSKVNILQHPMWPKWLKEKARLRGLAVVPGYKIDFEKLHAFKKPVLIVTGTSTIEPNKTVDKILSHEFSSVKTGSLPGGHIALYQNAVAFVEMVKAFCRGKSVNGY